MNANYKYFVMKLGGSGWDDVIMEIYLWFWNWGGVWIDDEWWREGGGGKKYRKFDDVICERPHKVFYASLMLYKICHK